jgi:hypothetical protein
MRKVGRVWVLEKGKPELAIFRPGVTDGRSTQVLPLGESQNLGRMAAQPEIAERMKKARERKIEPGTAVIVDSETPKKP